MDKIKSEQQNLENALIMEGDDIKLTKWLHKRRKIIARFESKLKRHDQSKRLID